MQHRATPTKPLSAQQHQAIQLLVEGKNVSETADLIGVHRSTVHRWMSENSDFITEYNQKLVEARTRTNDERRQIRARMFEILVGIASDETVAAATRARAARSVVELTGDVDESGPVQVTERIVYRSMEDADEGTKTLFRIVDQAQAQHSSGTHSVRT